MLGYVQIYKPELKVREYEIYQGYYCGVCKYIGQEYGQLPRMSLSYDAAFLALLLASIEDTPDVPTQEHCVVHHIKKKTIVRNDAIEYAGDVMLILAWYKLLDDIEDEGKTSAKIALPLLRGVHKKLIAKYPDLCRGVEANLAQLSKLEQEHCGSLDQVAEAFAKIMEVIFYEGSRLLNNSNTGGKTSASVIADDKASENGVTDATADSPMSSNTTTMDDFNSDKSLGNLHSSFAKIGYHMGKWIYLMDAADDIEENIESGAYNPLFYRFERGMDESAKAFRARIHSNLEFNLYQYLSVISKTLDDLDIKKNLGIINNIIYFGLSKKTEEILLKGTDDEKLEDASLKGTGDENSEGASSKGTSNERPGATGDEAAEESKGENDGSV